MATSTAGYTWINPHSREFIESVDLLKKKFVNNQGIPLCLTCSSSRCFTTTTATTLLALHYTRHLTDEMRVQFHETLFTCKNNTDGMASNLQQISTVAWDQLEGLSSWTTALAIWALLGTKYNGSRFLEIKEATLWLVKQRQFNGMWGRTSYDITDLLTTGLALHALKLVSDKSKAIGLTSLEMETIRGARKDTLGIIRKLALHQHNTIYWTGQTELGMQPDPTATLCAIWALHTSKGFEKDKMEEDAELIEGGIRYLRKTLHEQAQTGKIPIWPFRKVISSPPTAGHAFNVISFTPSFIIPLLTMQCDPFDEICFAPMQWLQQNHLEDEHGWSHENYGHNATHVLSFTTAYALWAISNWHKYAVKYNIRQHVITEKIRFQRNFILTLLVITSISFLFNIIARFLPPISIKLLAVLLTDANNVLQFLSAVFGVFTPLYIAFNSIGRKFFKKRLTPHYSRNAKGV